MKRNNENTAQGFSDEELLERYYYDNDNKWLGLLLPRYSLLLFGVCMKYLKNEEEAKDTVQQVFLKVINELYKFEVKNFKSWIYRVAQNECLMKLRTRKVIPLELTENHTKDEDDFGAKEIRQAAEGKIERLYESLVKLKAEQQQCLRYFYLEKKSYLEICNLTGYSLSQVKSYLQNGKRNLEILMAEKKDL